MDTNFFADSGSLPPELLREKRRLETEPAARLSCLKYWPEMERLDSDIKELVLERMKAYDYCLYRARDVQRALSQEQLGIEDLKALLSPAAEDFLEPMAQKARQVTSRHFGSGVYLFTPLYIANFCENYCVYCGFNRYSRIRRLKLKPDMLKREMELIAQAGLEEILILTGESRAQSDLEYIGQAVRLAKTYFRQTGLEIYPVNTDEYRYLHECGADYVTVFQETYDLEAYERLHLAGPKRVWPYRFEAQERALRGGMRGVAFAALLGLADFRRDALATALHAYYIQRAYPWAEISLSCPRLRPSVHNERLRPTGVGERQLCQIICALRLFLPFAGLTVSSRESAAFRDGIVKIAATKVSAGVSTAVGEHESRYKGGNSGRPKGDGQFIINDERDPDSMGRSLRAAGLQPIFNDYLYV